jgi:hypothetical protein
MKSTTFFSFGQPPNERIANWEAVVLDFVNPIRPGRWSHRKFGVSRGLGKLQREIKYALTVAFDHGGPMRIADIRDWFILRYGGNPDTDKLRPTHERSLKRALKGLIDKDEVLIIDGKGGPGDPRRYTTIECFAAATGKKVKDTAHAKAIVAELQDAVRKATSPCCHRVMA